MSRQSRAVCRSIEIRHRSRSQSGFGVPSPRRVCAGWGGGPVPGSQLKLGSSCSRVRVGFGRGGCGAFLGFAVRLLGRIRLADVDAALEVGTVLDADAL